MHIALLTLSYPPQTGGVQTYLAELMRRVARHHRVTVITPVPGNGPEPAGIRRLVVPMSLAPWFWLGLLRTRPDRVVVGHVHPQLLLAARLYTPCRFIALAYGNDYLATQKRWHRPVTNRLLAQARPLITISQANAAQLRSLGLPEPEIIYPGTDPDRFYPPQQRPAGPVLLTVSRLVPRKGIDRVILALSELVNDFPDLSYHIVGDGYDWGRLAQIADNADVWAAVGFFSGVSDEGLRQHYQESTLFVMPVRDDFYSADREGFGIVYLEAAACGLPVIAGRSGGAVEAVQDGVTGFLVDPIFIGELKEKISLLLTDRELAQRMGAAGRRWVETEMNWDRAAQQLLDILENGP